MNRRAQLKAWVASNADVLLLGACLASVGPLMAWWSVLVRRNIHSMDQMLRVQVMGEFDGTERAHRLESLDAATDRQLFMIAGESALAGLLLCILAVVLFMVARHRRAEAQRMQLMMQLSTHQLKTPLAGVRALLQSLGNGSIPEAVRSRFIAQGVGECDRLEHLVETTLAYQRAVARQAVRTERASTRQLVGNILDHRRSTFPDEQVGWMPGEELEVTCDGDAVRVILENLLDNARKYGGGHVEVSDGVCAGTWWLEVRDRGQGFQPRDAERLFEPFTREGGRGVSHGSGLGLYISRQLARQMRGELRARSEGVGQGSVFALELPVVKEGG
ncbi:MAG: HAMP domain-containing histidine kinase [Deltaproteobacteria bacterium]|nr:HAMP domain-containing histidine kinase [Deltaproteobacteria bacterium]